MDRHTVHFKDTSIRLSVLKPRLLKYIMPNNTEQKVLEIGRTLNSSAETSHVQALPRLKNGRFDTNLET